MDISNIKKAKVMVIGDVMIDRHLYGIVERISPEAPVPVVLEQKIEDVLGGASNVANNIASLGCDVFLLSVVGNDSDADLIDGILTEKRIQHRLVKDNERKTTIKQRIFAQNQQLLRIDTETKKDLSYDIEQELYNELRNALYEFKPNVIILSDYANGVITESMITSINTISMELNLKRPKILIDPKPSHLKRYYNYFMMTPNKKELLQMCNKNSLETSANELLKITGGEYILTTLSEDGYMLSNKKETYKKSTEAKQIYDPCGCGDTFIAVMACALSVGYDVKTASNLGNIAAGIVIEKIGTSTCTFEELKNKLIITS